MPAPVPTQARVRVRKHMPYKGGTKEWSNSYFLNSSSGPADQTKWHALMDAIVAAEKLVFLSYVVIDECIGYAGGSDLPISSKTYTQAGTGSFANGQAPPGNTAALIRYGTTQRTVKNHPIYLFNYYHGALQDSSGGVDILNPAQKTAMQTYGNAWVAGFSDGTVTFKKTGPFGAVAQDATVSTYLTHRDFAS